MIEKRKNVVLDVHERPSTGKLFTFSIQHLFAMFGATVLVPILIGLDPSVALLTSGLGTLAYILITKGQIPIYLGSSFAFIAPLIALKEQGIGAQMMGVFIVGVVYGIIALVIKKVGYQKMLQFLPPVVVGPIVIGIGLSLAATAVGMAAFKTVDGVVTYDSQYVIISLITLGITIFFSNFVKGFFGLVPIMMGIIGGYIVAAFMGVVDFQPVVDAKWFALPNVTIPFVDYTPTFSAGILLSVVFVVIAPICEHIGNVMLLGKIADKNFVQKPGLHRSILGDSVAIIISSFFGGVPNTTYGENIGVMALTKVFSIYVIGGAAVFAVFFSFIGKFSALILTIPDPVKGGVSLMLFGIIASGGLRMLIESNVNLSINRNLVIVATILTFSVGGMLIQMQIGNQTIAIQGIGLSAILGIVLNLILPDKAAGFGDSKAHL